MRQHILLEFVVKGTCAEGESALSWAVTVSKVGSIEARGRTLAVFCWQHKKDGLPGKVVAGDALGKLTKGGPVQLFFWPADHVGTEHRGFWR